MGCRVSRRAKIRFEGIFGGVSSDETFARVVWREFLVGWSGEQKGSVSKESVWFREQNSAQK